jgi:NADH:ubiquinone oxidoreductase subunit 5 (subunit L)/multisubunit Na+/H+ antiporter MnhA subunit
MNASWIWLTIALPFAGFLLNGALALGRPSAKRAVSIIGPGVLLAAFAVSAAIFLGLVGHPPEEPIIVPLWEWMAAGALDVQLSLQVDQLSLVMLLVVTGVGSLIHLFSVGYMRSSPVGSDSWRRWPSVVHSSRSISPASGVSALRMSENRVDFPAPFGPTSATRSA